MISNPNNDIQNQIAVLFDVENISPIEILPHLMKNLNELGYNNIFPRKLIFNDISQLKKALLSQVVKTYHLDLVCAYASVGKNIADFRLYIEALDLLYNKPEINSYCIVSGDADYAELVIKLHLVNKYVIGVGLKSKAKPEYIALFDKFIFIEELTAPKEEKPKLSNNDNLSEKESVKIKKSKKEPKEKKKIKSEEKAKAKASKKEIFLLTLRNISSDILDSYNHKGKDKINYSLLIKEIKANPKFNEKYKTISKQDIEKCGLNILLDDVNKPETAYILTKQNKEV